jgi:hypothetical protein
VPVMLSRPNFGRRRTEPCAPRSASSQYRASWRVVRASQRCDVRRARQVAAGITRSIIRSSACAGCGFTSTAAAHAPLHRGDGRFDDESSALAGLCSLKLPIMRLNSRLLISLLVSAACQSSTEPFAGVHVVTSVEARGIAAAPIAISTTIVNQSNRSFTFDGGACPSRFRIESADGLRIELPEQTCAAMAFSVTLAPGENYQLNEIWDGKDASGVRLIGAYRIIGQLPQ